MYLRANMNMASHNKKIIHVDFNELFLFDIVHMSSEMVNLKNQHQHLICISEFSNQELFW